MDPGLGISVFHLVNFPEERECVDGREVIPELWTLPEYRADLVGEFAALRPGNITQYFRLAAGWMQNARKHFDGSRFARAVGTNKAEQFARFHLEGEFAHSLDRT